MSSGLNSSGYCSISVLSFEINNSRNIYIKLISLIYTLPLKEDIRIVSTLIN